jgi:hypothetical protein
MLIGFCILQKIMRILLKLQKKSFKGAIINCSRQELIKDKGPVGEV